MEQRKRYDKDGNIIGWHTVTFECIPDDYEIKKIILNGKMQDLSYLGVMKYLRDIKAGEEFENDVFYSSEILSKMSLDYLNSALLLRQGIANDRGKDIVSYYVIPCAFLCKHSIELKLKECLLSKGERTLRGHSVLNLWKQLDEADMLHYNEITAFLEEVEKIDSNEMALRYGISKDLLPLQEKFMFDIDNFLNNTMYLFNIVAEYIICKYRFKGDDL